MNSTGNFTECITPVTGDQVGVAFALVVGAGLSTCLGAMVPCCLELRCCRKRRRPGFMEVVLALALSFSAGVMIYVSFVEIFVVKSVDAFRQCVADNLAYAYATLLFFAGIVLAWLLNVFVHFVEGKLTSNKDRKAMVTIHLGESLEEEFHAHMREQEGVSDGSGDSEVVMVELDESDSVVEMELDHEIAENGLTLAAIYEENEDHMAKLRLMSLFAAVAIAIHNFPEGLATFVAAVGDTKVGAVVAVAIALHNIPEGMVVAIPMYAVTKSKWKAFAWGSLSGLTEPIGALLGWVVLVSTFSGIAYGVLFSLVAGMMVYISLKELLPTARRYDPEDKYVTWSLLAGFLVMALSLVLFAI